MCATGPCIVHERVLIAASRCCQGRPRRVGIDGVLSSTPPDLGEGACDDRSDLDGVGGGGRRRASIAVGFRARSTMLTAIPGAAGAP